jgi:hypothetical protein
VGTSLTAGQRALEVVLTGKLGNRTVIGLVIDGSNPLNGPYEVAVSQERIRLGRVA